MSDLQHEERRDIVCYEGKYQVSNLGRVRSLEYHNAKGIKRIGILKLATDGRGYLRCALSKNNILTTFKVHRLVAQHFIPNPNNYDQVNHINGIKKDNRVENLEFCNNSMNQLHACKLGLRTLHCPKHYPVILTNSETGETLRFETLKLAGEYVGVHYRTIQKWAYGNKPYRRKHWKYSVRFE